jgi:hypothetical protein
MCPSVATCLSGSVVLVVDMFSLGIYFQGDFAIPSVRLGGEGVPFREILLFLW